MAVLVHRPYLASGVISARQILTQVLKYSGKKVLPVDKKDGAGNWVGEVAWRDFYNHVRPDSLLGFQPSHSLSVLFVALDLGGLS